MVSRRRIQASSSSQHDDIISLPDDIMPFSFKLSPKELPIKTINRIMEACNCARSRRDFKFEIWCIEYLIDFIVIEISDEWRQNHWRVVYKIMDMIECTINSLLDVYDNIDKRSFVNIEQILVNVHILKTLCLPTSAWSISNEWDIGLKTFF